MGWIDKKETVEDTASLDILSMQKAGVFKKGRGHRWTCTWERGDEKGNSIAYWLEAVSRSNFGLALHFEYSHTPYNGETQNLDYLVPVVPTPCNLGGVRWWYLCPLSNCLKRCRILYLPYGAEYFGCRKCHKLTYESRQFHRNKFYEAWLRPKKKIERFQEKLEKVRCPQKKAQLMKQYTELRVDLSQSQKFYLNRMKRRVHGHSEPD